MDTQPLISRRGVAALAAMALAAPAAWVAVSHAEPATSGVVPTQLVRGTFAPFKVTSHKDAPFDFTAKSKEPTDILVRRHDYAAGHHTGWHKHPGPVFITVTKGTLTYYLYEDEECTAHHITAPGTFVDDGGGHVVRNETGEPAQDVSVIIAPTNGGAFRSNLANPGPHCPF